MTSRTRWSCLRDGGWLRRFRRGCSSFLIKITVWVNEIQSDRRLDRIGTRNSIGIRYITGRIFYSNFVEKSLIASWGHLWNSGCNSTNRQATVLKLRGDVTNNITKVSAVELVPYRTWFLRYWRWNTKERVLALRMGLDQNDGVLGRFRRGFRWKSAGRCVINVRVG